MRLSQKVILVTGGASGIGRAIVKRFTAEGARVYFTDIDEASGLDLSRASGAIFLQHDVSSVASWRQVEDKFALEEQRLAVLVNNAGVVSGKPIDELDQETWQRIISVNLTGTLWGCQMAIRLMRKADISGSIINIASSTAELGLANDAAYTASKAGVAGLTRSIATHCAREGLGIRCNNLSPGPTETEILRAASAADPKVEAALRLMTPVGRLAKPEEIAAMAVFLASDESSYCTGGNYLVDGGLCNAHPTM